MKAGTRLYAASAALAILVVVALAYGQLRAPVSRAGPAEPLVIAIAPSPAFALVYIADANGYLAQEGLAVTLKIHSLGRDALQGAIFGGADIAVAYDTPAVLQIYQGRPLAIVSTVHTSTSGHALVVRRDRGISQPRDLAGKRIGVTPGTSTEYFLSLFLSSAGLAPADVRVVPIEPADYEKALAGTGVDAIVAFNPTLFRLMQEGKGRFIAFPSDLYVETSVLLGLRERVLERQEAITRLLRALVRAQEFASAQPEASMRIVLEWLNGRYPEDSVRQGWDAFTFDVRLDHALLNQLTEEGRWFRDMGLYNGPVPEFADFIVTAPLRRAKPGAVSLFKPVAR